MLYKSVVHCRCCPGSGMLCKTVAAEGWGCCIDCCCCLTSKMLYKTAVVVQGQACYAKLSFSRVRDIV